MSTQAARASDRYTDLFSDVSTEEGLEKMFAEAQATNAPAPVPRRASGAHSARSAPRRTAGAHAARSAPLLLVPTRWQRITYWAWHPVSRIALAVVVLAAVVVAALQLASQVTITRSHPRPTAPVVTVTLPPTTAPQQTVTAPLQTITVTKAAPLPSRHP